MVCGIRGCYAPGELVSDSREYQEVDPVALGILRKALGLVGVDYILHKTPAAPAGGIHSQAALADDTRGHNFAVGMGPAVPPKAGTPHKLRTPPAAGVVRDLADKYLRCTHHFHHKHWADKRADTELGEATSADTHMRLARYHIQHSEGMGFGKFAADFHTPAVLRSPDGRIPAN